MELEFRGELRSRLLETIDPAPADEVTAESGFELDGRRLGVGEAAAWLDEHAPAGERVGVSITGSWRAGTGEVADTPHWLTWFAVADTDATVALATARGAELASGPFDVPTVGRTAILIDPLGASFGVLQGETPDE